MRKDEVFRAEVRRFVVEALSEAGGHGIKSEKITATVDRVVKALKPVVRPQSASALPQKHRKSH